MAIRAMLSWMCSDVSVPGATVLVTVALFLVAVLILVGADVRTIESSGTVSEISR